MISLISSSVFYSNWLSLTSISMILGLLIRLSFKVAAWESWIWLQEISSLRIALFCWRNSARLSQKIWPRELLDSDKNSRFEALFIKSRHSFEPALSSNLFNLRLRFLRILFTFNAWAKYLLPSYPIWLSAKLRVVRIWVESKNFAIFLAPELLTLLWERSRSLMVLFSTRPFIKMPIKSSSRRFPGRLRYTRF